MPVIVAFVLMWIPRNMLTPFGLAKLSGPMHAIQMVFLYIITRFLVDRIRNVPSRKLLAGSLLFAACMILVCGGASIAYRYFVGMPFVARSIASFITYSAPHVWLWGIVVVVVFSRFEFAESINRMIAFLAPSAFSVYLIHSCTNIGNQFQRGCTAWALRQWPELWPPLQILLAAAVVFLVCLLVDLIRRALLQPFKSKISSSLMSLDKRLPV